MDNTYVFIVLLIISLITIALRAFPIIIFDKFKEYGLLIYISKKMPVGVMCLLVIYTLKDEDYLREPFGIPILLSSSAAIFLYLKTKNALIAIFGSLFIYLGIENYAFFYAVLIGINEYFFTKIAEQLDWVKPEASAGRLLVIRADLFVQTI